MDEPTSGLDLRAAAIVMRTVRNTVNTGVTRIKDVQNPATCMLEVSSPMVEAQLGVDFAMIYATSELFRRNQELIKELRTPAPGSQDLYFLYSGRL
ncbi:hypothetical protein CTI12_AA149340 [Artemisia annua]|uniref:Uncharacterized protein n=1 Tax=Artemisia annua TaxID=35608 RepID=A0A2U1NF03_ARTAN|nr:hypothetical protein CTI12_AA149340 [Artemisia annua]